MAPPSGWTAFGYEDKLGAPLGNSDSLPVEVRVTPLFAKDDRAVEIESPLPEGLVRRVSESRLRWDRNVGGAFLLISVGGRSLSAPARATPFSPFACTTLPPIMANIFR